MAVVLVDGDEEQLISDNRQIAMVGRTDRWLRDVGEAVARLWNAGGDVRRCDVHGSAREWDGPGRRAVRFPERGPEAAGVRAEVHGSAHRRQLLGVRPSSV